jgi:hypothetical protein
MFYEKHDTTCIVASAMELALHCLLCRISRDQDKVITFKTACIVGGVYVLRPFKMFLLAVEIIFN